MQASDGVAVVEQEGNSEENPREEAVVEAAKQTEDMKALLQKLRKLSKSQRTLDLASSIFADVRVRTLGYM